MRRLMRLRRGSDLRLRGGRSTESAAELAGDRGAVYRATRRLFLSLRLLGPLLQGREEHVSHGGREIEEGYGALCGSRWYCDERRWRNGALLSANDRWLGPGRPPIGCDGCAGRAGFIWCFMRTTMRRVGLRCRSLRLTGRMAGRWWLWICGLDTKDPGLKPLCCAAGFQRAIQPAAPSRKAKSRSFAALSMTSFLGPSYAVVSSAGWAFWSSCSVAMAWMEASNGARRTPRSVMMAVMYFAAGGA